jgi:hypothetical protein
MNHYCDIRLGMPLDTPNLVYVLPLNARKVSRIVEEYPYTYGLVHDVVMEPQSHHMKIVEQCMEAAKYLFSGSLDLFQVGLEILNRTTNIALALQKLDPNNGSRIRSFAQPLERWSQPREDKEFVSGLREL